VVAAGSFNAAAARLGYTQSAVSAQIRTLERLVGMRLLDRSRGVEGVRLTKAGDDPLAIRERHRGPVRGGVRPPALRPRGGGRRDPARHGPRARGLDGGRSLRRRRPRGRSRAGVCDVAAPRVESLRVTSDVPPRTLALAWHRERVSSLAARQFVRIASEAAEELHAAPQTLRVS